MAISKETRLKVEHELRMGKTAKDLAEKYDISYPTVIGWKKKLDESTIIDEPINNLIEVDEQTLVAVAEKVKAEAPDIVKKKIDKLVDGITGLQRLDEKFHALVFDILEQAEVFLAEPDIKPKDWAMIAGTIGSLYTAIFSKNVTNVNVMNNTNISSEKREIFKASKGV